MYIYFLLCLQGSDFVFECVHNHSTNNVGGDVMVQQSLNLATDNKNARMSRVRRHHKNSEIGERKSVS